MPFLKVAALLAGLIGLFELRSSFVDWATKSMHAKANSGTYGIIPPASDVADVHARIKGQASKEIVVEQPLAGNVTKEQQPPPGKAAPEAKPQVPFSEVCQITLLSPSGYGCMPAIYVAWFSVCLFCPKSYTYTNTRGVGSCHEKKKAGHVKTTRECRGTDEGSCWRWK
jgi:hypothetical protein